MKNSMSVLIAIMFASILLCATDQIKAQRPIDPPTHMECNEYATTPIDHCPPLNTGMSWDCMLGYIYFDSLCRANLTWGQLDSLAKAINSMDTLRPFLRFQYAMNEYDASLYDEFMFYGIDITPGYKTPPAIILSLLLDREDSILGHYSKVRFLANTELILHVKVVEVTSDIEPTINRPLQCFKAIILDTIKGKNFPSNLYYTLPGGKLHREPQSEGYPAIGFVISPEWQKYGTPSDFRVVATDSAGHRAISGSNQFGENAVAVDSEYIVCLNVQKEVYDGAHVFRDYWPATHYSPEAGLFRINPDHKVMIPSDFFGYGTSVPLATFLSMIRADIHNIVAH